MSTSAQPLKYLFVAYFKDGTSIVQNSEDKYSKHDEAAEYNPSAFRDVVDRLDEVEEFSVGGLHVFLENGTFKLDGHDFSLETEQLTDRKLIFFREIRQEFNPQTGEEGEKYVNRYAVGYEGKNSEGKVEKKVVYIN